MALPMPPNVSVDIYTGANPSSPYPGGAPRQPSVPGYLQPRVQTGRHGTALYLKWTHILYVGPAVDVRDAYNSQFNSPTTNNADTVVLSDSTNPTTARTAFYVVFVEVALHGTGYAHQRVYLDRFQPSQWPTDAL